MSITVTYTMKEIQHAFSFTKNTIILTSLCLITLLIAGTWSLQHYYDNQLTIFKETTLQRLSEEHEQKVMLLKEQNENQLFVLASKIGDLQAQMNNLNALGQRVIEKSEFPIEEFDFNTPLPVGGPEIEITPVDYKFNDLLNQVDYIDDNLKNREKQLDRLEITLNNLHLIDQLYISGRPVKGKGSWLSSPFGVRKDPFTGRLTQHKGVDIAGFTGMPIIATAAGVVTESGKRSGYGLMVEIQHGNGLVTRYAHAQSLNVAVGDIVNKGQQIAIMGSTGRSTGAHVHYEILKNGKPINPNKYIQRKAV